MKQNSESSRVRIMDGETGVRTKLTTNNRFIGALHFQEKYGYFRLLSAK
jgi:hypothetical protein